MKATENSSKRGRIVREREIKAKLSEKEDINAKSHNRDSTGNLFKKKRKPKAQNKGQKRGLVLLFIFFFYHRSCLLAGNQSDSPGDLKSQGEWVEPIKTNVFPSFLIPFPSSFTALFSLSFPHLCLLYCLLTSLMRLLSSCQKPSGQ